MKRTKMQQKKTGEPTKSPETKSRKRSTKKKLNSTETFYLQKPAKKNWKVIHRILNLNMNTLQANTSAPNEFFNKTAERHAMQNATTDGVILSHIDSFTSSHDSFKLQKVT